MLSSGIVLTRLLLVLRGKEPLDPLLPELEEWLPLLVELSEPEPDLFEWAVMYSVSCVEDENRFLSCGGLKNRSSSSIDDCRASLLLGCVRPPDEFACDNRSPSLVEDGYDVPSDPSRSRDTGEPMPMCFSRVFPLTFRGVSGEFSES